VADRFVVPHLRPPLPAVMIGGLFTSFLMELLVYPAIREIKVFKREYSAKRNWKRRMS
jgi:Cu/Ag efflux pump CusA